MDSVFAGTGLAGMRQRDLIQWYVAQQNEKNNYSSVEEAANEVSKIKAIIEVTNNHAFYQVCNIFLRGIILINKCLWYRVWYEGKVI